MLMAECISRHLSTPGHTPQAYIGFRKTTTKRRTWTPLFQDTSGRDRSDPDQRSAACDAGFHMLRTGSRSQSSTSPLSGCPKLAFASQDAASSQALHEVYATCMGCAVRLVKGFVQPIEGTSSSFVISNWSAPLRREKSSHCSEMTCYGLFGLPAMGSILMIFVNGRLVVPCRSSGLNVWQWWCRQESMFGVRDHEASNLGSLASCGGYIRSRLRHAKNSESATSSLALTIKVK
jgi:hypothetical protein